MRRITVALILVLASACAGETESPSGAGGEAEVEVAGPFELSGTVESVGSGEGPEDVDLSRLPQPSPAADDADTAGSEGELRLQVGSASQIVTDTCGINPNEVVAVYWTTRTVFEPPGAAGPDEIDGLRGAQVKAQGRVVPLREGSATGSGRGNADQDPGIGEELGESPAADRDDGAGGARSSPGTDGDAGDTQPDDTLGAVSDDRCVLVADHVSVVAAETSPAPDRPGDDSRTSNRGGTDGSAEPTTGAN